MVIACHIILTGYGHWLPNDPRGGMSAVTHIPRIAALGEGHFGRKTDQPSRGQLRRFHQRAGRALAHPVLWWNDAERQAIVRALSLCVAQDKLTCYACAVMCNHVHLLVRKHRLRFQEMSDRFKSAGRKVLLESALAPPGHPIFSADCCHIFKSTPESVRTCARYIPRNFAKHNIKPVDYPFVSPYDNWPFHKNPRPK